MSKKIAVVSLGCDKNRVDTEQMLWYLSRGDYEITADYADAEIIIVNTCAFIESARIEAIDTILEMATYKESGKCQKLIVTGCLVEKNRAEVIEGFPEVDAVLGVDEYEKIRACIEGGQPDEKGNGRVLTSPPHYAYLRIADGCDNKCTFCTIPSIRGKYRSVPIEKIVEEANDFITKGVSELILVAQDVTAYGKDIYGEPSLIKLLEELVKTDAKWIRLLYCYPELVTDELIDMIASEEKIVKYIDIPMQHVSDTVLKRMNRRNKKHTVEEICDKLKKKGIVLRTTFMVGFPGETEEEFNELVEFMKAYKPERVGVFAYSKEAGTPSAKIKGHLTKREKIRRVNIIGKLHLQNAIEFSKRMIGKVVDVIYEDIDYERNAFRGRTQFDAPDIDCVVYFTGEFADVGNVYRVKITDYDEYDLIGEIV